jgi:hypothetical protein
MSDASERLADVARMAAQGCDLTALATARGFEAIVESLDHATVELTQAFWQSRPR